MATSDFKPILSREEIPKKMMFKEIPEGLILKRGEWFCPLCGHASVWKTDEFYKSKRCSWCGLSESEFWVRMVNKIWGDMSLKKNKVK